MKNSIFTSLLLVALIAGFSHVLEAQRGGGRGGGGGGARMSAARAGVSRSMPSNYGSMRPTTQSSFSSQRSARSDFNINDHRGESASFETRHGGEIRVGVSEGGNVGVRGETAGGRDYGGIQAGGDRLIAGEDASGDVKVRYRGDGDGVIDSLPNGYDTIYIHDNHYYYHDHHYYWPYYYGGVVYYQEVYPPYGTTADNLPTDVTTETIGGIDYYIYDDVYYVKEGEHYVVSAPPETADGSASNNPIAAAIMREMCRHLASYTNFIVETVEQVERPNKGHETVKRRILVSLPNRLAAAGREGSRISHFWYDGKTVTTLDVEKNVYSTIDAPPTIREMLNMMQDEYGTAVPLADLLTPELCDALGPELDSMTYVGRDEVSGKSCHKLSLLTDDYGAEIWIDADEKAPILRKVDIVYMTPSRRLKYTATINRMESKAEFEPELFVFHAPDDAVKIEMLKQP